MGLFSSLTTRKKDDIAMGGVGIRGAGGSNQSDVHIPRTISNYKLRSHNLLEELRCTRDVYKAIELIAEKHPDANMARNSYNGLANVGHRMEIFSSGDRNTEAETLWNEFAARTSYTNTKGFDGIIEQCHDSLLLYGGFGMELPTDSRLKDIIGTYAILPQWIRWEQDGYGNWEAIQQQGHDTVCVSDGNFFWVALNHKVGQPNGSLMFESSLLPIEMQLEFFKDTDAVLKRAGYPRNDVSVDRAAFVASLPASIKNNDALKKEAMAAYLNDLVRLWDGIGALNDTIHFDDVTVNKTSADNSRSMDTRAHHETIDSQVVNGLSIPSLFLNRSSGVTETWGTVQFKIVVQTITQIQQSSKRLAEQICDFFLRVHGIHGKSKFTHNPVDWEAEEKKYDVLLKKQEQNRKAEEFGWQDKPTAAKNAMNIDTIPAKGFGEQLSLYVKQNKYGEDENAKG